MPLQGHWSGTRDEVLVVTGGCPHFSLHMKLVPFVFRMRICYRVAQECDLLQRSSAEITIDAAAKTTKNNDYKTPHYLQAVLKR